jgi:hypothetical protein
VLLECDEEYLFSAMSIVGRAFSHAVENRKGGIVLQAAEKGGKLSF